MNTRTIAIIVAFAALTIVLNPVSVPALYAPFSYRIWEIPIVAAFLLFGFKIAVSILVLNAGVRFALFPGSTGVLGPPWAVVVTLSMLLGVYLASKLITRRVTQGKPLPGNKPTVDLTTLGIIFRTGIMLPVDYAVFRYLFPLVLGRNLPEAVIIALLPGDLLFNITVPLYVIPIAYLMTKTVSRNLKVGNKF